MTFRAAPTPAPAGADPADALDRAALHASAGGDRLAFEALYRRHHPRLSRFLRRFNTRGEVIDAVVNDTMWVVWCQAGSFRGASKVSTWVTGIAYRCMLKALREAGPAASQAEADAADAAHDDPAPGRELRDWVASGLRTLPEDLRTTLELAYFMGLSCEEIGEVMGCASGTVKARLFHARVRLRNVMPALGGQQAPDSSAARG